MTWHTEQRKISDLVPFPQNPRQMSDKQIQDLTSSLQKFDLVEIPAINLDNTLLAGHQRLKIMAVLGRGEEVVDVRVPDRMLTAEEAQEYVLRSNKNIGEWDWSLLAKIGEDLLREVGFDDDDLARMSSAKMDDMIDTHEVDISRLDVIIVDGPGSPRIKNRRGFYFDTMKEFEAVVKLFETKTEYKLDGKKLLELARKK